MGFWSEARSELAAATHSAETAAAAKLAEIRAHPVQALEHAGKAAYNFVVGDDIHTLRDPKASIGEKALAVVSIASNFVGPEGKLLTHVAEFGVKALVEHGAEHLVENAVEHLETAVGREAVAAARHAAEKALPHAAKAAEALATTVKAVNTAHNVEKAAVGLPDHVRRSIDDVETVLNPHLSAAQRVHAAADGLKNLGATVADGATIYKGAVEGVHGAKAVKEHVETARTKVEAAATHATTHLAQTAEHATQRLETAAHRVTTNTSHAATSAVAHADRAVHNVTAYVAHHASTVARDTAHVVADTAKRAAHAADRVVSAAHLPASVAHAVHTAEHTVTHATEDAAKTATAAIRAGRSAVNAESHHLAKDAEAAIHAADASVRATTTDAARAAERKLAALEHPAPHAPQAPHAPGPESVLAKAGHAVAHAAATVTEPLRERFESLHEKATAVKDKALAAADRVTSGKASDLVANVGEATEAQHARKETNEAREAAAKALERMTPEARELAAKSGYAQVGMPHLQATPWNGRAEQSGTVTSVVGDRVEQFGGRGQWTTYDSSDLKALKKVLAENALDHSERLPSKIVEGDRLTVSSTKIVLEPRDPSKEAVTVTLDRHGHGTLAPTVTQTSPHQQAAGAHR